MAKREFKEFKQGKFKPRNKDKCVNKEDIVYRSGLELQVMLLLDKNPNVIKWGSENVVIPYKHPIRSAQSGKPEFARYFMDFYVKQKIGDVVKEFLYEVKPKRQTVAPTKHGNKKQSTIVYENQQWAVNSAKWDAAEKYCKDKGWIFLLITEDTISRMIGK